MAASDWAYYDKDKDEYGYWIEDGAIWVPLTEKPEHGRQYA
jgi:hypothetical protein